MFTYHYRLITHKAFNVVVELIIMQHLQGAELHFGGKINKAGDCYYDPVSYHCKKLKGAQTGSRVSVKFWDMCFGYLCLCTIGLFQVFVISFLELLRFSALKVGFNSCNSNKDRQVVWIYFILFYFYYHNAVKFEHTGDIHIFIHSRVVHTFVYVWKIA